MLFDYALIMVEKSTTAPLISEALVSLAQPRNVDTVVADGRILRRAGAFTALDHAEVLRQASDAGAALRARAGQG